MSPTMSRMIPAKSLAKYSYDATKVTLTRKKTPLNKLVPVGMTEKQLEKELNEGFAQVRFHCGYLPCLHEASSTAAVVTL